MNTITRVRVTGFKSIREQEIELRPLNVMIGANGSGKSNLVAMFRMLSFAMSDSLQTFIARNGGGNSLLYYGAKTTTRITGTFSFKTYRGTNTYYMQLDHAGGDTLIFSDECVDFRGNTDQSRHAMSSLGAGHRETAMPAAAAEGNTTAKAIKRMMDRWKFFQFHDTSQEAKIRQKGYKGDNAYLRADAGNLAAFLYRMQQTRPEHYQRIRRTVQMAAPFFGDFAVSTDADNSDYIRLDWRERDNDMLFGPHMVSDGTLRFMALAALLQQPTEWLPEVIVIDEPELGLHPFAITLLGSMLRGISEHAQIIVSTQSAELLNQFEPGDVIVAQRQMEEEAVHRYQSVFRRLDAEALNEWLEDYTLSELWDKNVLGGRPSL